MPQIDIPFTPAQRVRTPSGIVFVIDGAAISNGRWEFSGDGSERWWRSDSLTLVEPVIEWERNGPDTGWLSEDRVWYADDKGTLTWETHIVGTFPNPRAVAEATQKLWNEAREG